MYPYGLMPAQQMIAPAPRRMFGKLTLTIIGTSLAIAAQASAQTWLIAAEGDPAAPSFFTLDFGEGLGPTSAGITTTNFTLAVNASEGKARFASYHQEVDPLILPGDISTGNLVIEVVEGTSSGTYDPRTGVFATTELYAIFFDGDLSLFGIESPFFLPGASSGIVTTLPGRFGRIVMNWVGTGILPDPSDPNGLLDFSYICIVNTVFGPGTRENTPLDLRGATRDLGAGEGLENGVFATPGHRPARLDRHDDRDSRRAGRGRVKVP